MKRFISLERKSLRSGSYHFKKHVAHNVSIGYNGQWQLTFFLDGDEVLNVTFDGETSDEIARLSRNFLSPAERPVLPPNTIVNEGKLPPNDRPAGEERISVGVKVDAETLNDIRQLPRDVLNEMVRESWRRC